MPPRQRPVPGPVDPAAQAVLDRLGEFESFAIDAAITLRDFGLPKLADSLCGEIGHLRQITRTAALCLPGAVRTTVLEHHE
jgi:hypothetical protein